MISLDPVLAAAIRERPADDELRLRAATQMPAEEAQAFLNQLEIAQEEVEMEVGYSALFRGALTYDQARGWERVPFAVIDPR